MSYHDVLCYFPHYQAFATLYTVYYEEHKSILWQRYFHVISARSQITTSHRKPYVDFTMEYDNRCITKLTTKMLQIKATDLLIKTMIPYSSHICNYNNLCDINYWSPFHFRRASCAITLIGSATWWRHQMETFSALLAICARNSPFPAQRPVTQSFDVFFVLRLNKRLSKQSCGRRFETLSRPLWRHRNGCVENRGCTTSPRLKQSAIPM